MSQPYPETLGFVRSRPGVGSPNVQLFFSPVSYTKAPPGKRPLMNPHPFSGILIGAQPMRPTSRGHLEIRSKDPFKPIAIHPNCLATEFDVQEILEASRPIRQFAETGALSRIIKAERAPGPQAPARNPIRWLF